MTVTFCGHSQISMKDNVQEWLTRTVEQLIADGADTFYLGGYGAFDHLAASVLRELKKTHTHIKLVLVLAYLNRDANTSGYDCSIYPELESVPPRFAISKRNEYMVNMSDAVVAYVTHGWGGAAKTLQYARRKKKTIYSFSYEGGN